MISTRARNLLRRVLASEDQELVYEKGAGWWLDCDPVNGCDALELARFCLLSCPEKVSMGRGQLERWVPNSESEKVVKDPDYVPMIVRALRQRKGRTQKSSD